MVSIALVVVLAISMGYLWPTLKRRYAYSQWYRSHQLHELEPLFNTIFKNVNGFERSKSARKDYDLTDYVYGEIVFLPFAALLSALQWDKEDIFYDLGSGIGKSVFACAMVCPVKKAVGIELLHPLYQASQMCKALLFKNPGYQAVAAKIHFIHANFLDANFSDATVVFVNATTLHRATWDGLCQRITQTPSIRMVLTTSKPISSSIFHTTRKITVQMSWGIVDVYVSVKSNLLA